MARRARLLAPLLSLFVACSPATPAAKAVADPTSLRKISTGAVVGFAGGYGAHVWLGLPYARPPVGPRRWRAPEAPEAWSGERAALAAGHACPQFPSIFGGVPGDDPAEPVGDEDCLYVNVYAPRFAPGEVPAAGRRLPVLFWIHGGGNVIGQAINYDGGNLARTEKVVVVALNYRLGPLGWFRHAALRARAENDLDRSGNYGTLDLVRGLEWVRDEIAAFGGDPGNVTIFGESAGGRDVFTLLLAPQARGLFHRAIVESGGTSTTTIEEAESLADATPRGHHNSSSEIVLRRLRKVGRASSRADAIDRAGALTPREVEALLRSTSAADLLRLYRTEDQEGLVEAPQVFRDGAVLPAGDPVEAIGEGRANPVPVVLGTNRDENKLFLAFNRELVWNVFGVLPIVRDRTRYEVTARHLSALWKANGADRPAAGFARANGGAAWVYRFDWDEEPDRIVVDVSKLLGAAHGFEIPFVFGHWDLGARSSLFFTEGNRPGREELSRKMMSYWSAFARAGDPGAGNDGTLPRWQRFDAARGGFLVLDTESGGGIRMEEGILAQEDVIAAVDADPDVADAAAKCEVYRRLVEWGRGPSRAEYPKLGAKGCAEYPLRERSID